MESEMFPTCTAGFRRRSSDKDLPSFMIVSDESEDAISQVVE